MEHFLTLARFNYLKQSEPIVECLDLTLRGSDEIAAEIVNC